MKRLLAGAACFVVSAVALSSSVENETQEFDIEGLRKIELKSMRGDVNIVAAPGKAKVSARKVEFDKGCKLTMRRSGDELEVEVDKDVLSKASCAVNFDVQLPSTIDIDAKIGMGNLSVEGTRGEVDFELGSGAAKIKAHVSELEGKSGNGAIEVSGLVGDAELKTGNGNISVTYAAMPPKGKLEIRTGSGNAEVFLPQDAKIASDFKTGSGLRINDFGDTAGAPFKIEMRSGIGNLSIKKL